MTEKEKEVLFACGLFSEIPTGEAERLLTCLHGEEAHYEKNAVVWHMGDPVSACAVVLSGTLRAETVNAAGEHSLMACHRAGGLVGDVLMATPGGRSPVYVVAEEAANVFFLPYSQIMDGCPRCCGAHRCLRENLLSEIARKFWAQRQRIRCLSTQSLRSRIAMHLLELSREAGSATFTVSGTREDLADYLCVNRSALCRELSRMKQEGLIDYYRDTFRIQSPEALER